MSDEEFQKLAKLSKREREVLWLVCEGNSYDAISKKLFISEPTVKTDMGRVYVKLGLDQLSRAERIKAIHQTYCPLMRNTELPPEEPESQKPEPVPEPVSRMVDEDENAIIPYRPEPKDIIIIDGKQPPQPHRHWWLLVLGLTLGVGLTIASITFFNNRQQSQLVVELTRTVAQLTQAAVEPTVMATQVAVVPTPEATQVPAKPTIPPTKQPIVVNTATQPPAPTNPPASPVPILSPTPLIALPFSDNFDNGPSSQWQVLSGNWITVEGKYTPAENDNGWSLSALDDPSWKNYRVQVDVNVPHMYSAAQGQFGIIVRISSGQSKYFGFAVDGLSRGFWANITADDPSPRPIADFGSFKVPPQFHLDLEVRGNQFVARVNGQEIQSMSMNGSDNGGIALGVSCISSMGCPEFDNLKIDPLP